MEQTTLSRGEKSARAYFSIRKQPKRPKAAIAAFGLWRRQVRKSRWLAMSFPLLFIYGYADSSMELSDLDWLWNLFPFIFIGMWVVVCLALSRFGGWAELAHRYGSDAVNEGGKFRFRSGALKWVSYNNCLTFTVGRRGFGMSVLFLFRLGHPALMIPWADISMTTEKRFFTTVARLTFSRAPSVTLTIPVALAETMQLAGKVGSAQRST